MHLNSLQSLFKVFSIIITLTVSCLPFSAFSAEGITATGDFETGDFSQWLVIQADDESRQAKIVTSPVRQGKYAAKFIVEDGDKYSDTSGERSLASTLSALRPRNGPDRRDSQGSEFFYAWSTLFPKDLPPVVNWRPVFMEWHSENGGTQPVLSFNIDPATMNIIVKRVGGKCSTRDCGDRAQYDTIVKNAAQGVWNDFVVHAKWSCSNNGLIEVWHKYENENSYEKVLSVHNIDTLQSSSYWGNCMKIYKLQGLYRSSSEKSKQVIYHDSFTQGTSFDAVTKHAHNTVATQNEKLAPPANLQFSHSTP